MPLTWSVSVATATRSCYRALDDVPDDGVEPGGAAEGELPIGLLSAFQHLAGELPAAEGPRGRLDESGELLDLLRIGLRARCPGASSLIALAIVRLVSRLG